ncbi:MAG: hypothetical protein IJB11_05390, partial [Oscillospiraceae bacterium]|nr:hypothetical protein [Oscillospiraceae bacterium]
LAVLFRIIIAHLRLERNKIFILLRSSGPNKTGHLYGPAEPLYITNRLSVRIDHLASIPGSFCQLPNLCINDSLLID